MIDRRQKYTALKLKKLTSDINNIVAEYEYSNDYNRLLDEMEMIRERIKNIICDERGDE